MLRIFLNFKVVTATCEHLFSKLNLIKLYILSSLGQERFPNMYVIKKEVTCTLDYSELGDMFAKVKLRKT